MIVLPVGDGLCYVLTISPPLLHCMTGRKLLLTPSTQPSSLELSTRQSPLSALFATHPRISGVTPLFATLPETCPRKSFVCHTYNPLPRFSVSSPTPFLFLLISHSSLICPEPFQHSTSDPRSSQGREFQPGRNGRPLSFASRSALPMTRNLEPAAPLAAANLEAAFLPVPSAHCCP
jgi:hypothetical protein